MRIPFYSRGRRVIIVTILLLVAYHLLVLPTPTPRAFQFSRGGHGREKYPFPLGPQTANEHRAAAVIDVFRSAWRGYSEHCFGHDEFRPVSRKCDNSRNGWGASIVDALSTAIIMGQQDIVQDILNHIPKINFSKTGVWWPQTVNLFETTIRYIGGLLAGYDLLRSRRAGDLGIDEQHINMLLAQAKVLADALKYAFDTPSGVPFNRLWLEIGSHAANQETNSLAAAGSLVLEWQHLSDLIGDAEYGDLARETQTHILDPKPEKAGLYPGLLGTHLDIETGNFRDVWGSWGAGRDSAYEYLLKMFIYDPNRFSNYGARWVKAAESTIKYMSSHPLGRDNLTFIADWAGKNRVLKSDHLAAFAAGNFILGGSVYRRQNFIDFGLRLVNTLHTLQSSTATGISPEAYSWNRRSVPADQAEFFDQNGFWITNGVYNTRPEVLESYYYAYRITSDTKYRDWAWEAFQNIVRACQTDWGLSYIENVNSKDPLGGNKMDFQDSFVFAEVLKYSYLIFADDAPWQTQSSGKNDFVFNTEGHPLRVADSTDERGLL